MKRERNKVEMRVFYSKSTSDMAKPYEKQRNIQNKGNHTDRPTRPVVQHRRKTGHAACRYSVRNEKNRDAYRRNRTAQDKQHDAEGSMAGPSQPVLRH
jgi:hypothetical protein